MTMLVLYLDICIFRAWCEQLTVKSFKTCHFQAKYIVAVTTEMGYNVRRRHTKFISLKYSLEVAHSTISFQSQLV
jgi:hypothetical protein